MSGRKNTDTELAKSNKTSEKKEKKPEDQQKIIDTRENKGNDDGLSLDSDNWVKPEIAKNEESKNREDKKDSGKIGIETKNMEKIAGERKIMNKNKDNAKNDEIPKGDPEKEKNPKSKITVKESGDEKKLSAIESKDKDQSLNDTKEQNKSADGTKETGKSDKKLEDSKGKQVDTEVPEKIQSDVKDAADADSDASEIKESKDDVKGDEEPKEEGGDKADSEDKSDDKKKSEEPSVYGHPVFENLPLAPQVTNGCGLASLIMNVNPEKTPAYADFLDRLFDIIKKFMPFVAKISVKEFQWAYALQALLLKSQAYGSLEFLYEFLNERMEYAFEDQRFINRSMVEGYKQLMVQKRKVDYLEHPMTEYLEYGYLNYVMIDHFIKIMKTDIELKILMEFFDYKFEYQNTGDIFGAVVFDTNEIRKPGDSVLNKLKILKEKLTDPDYRIFFGIGHHWVAMTAIVDKNQYPEENGANGANGETKQQKRFRFDPKHVTILFNDPMTPRKSQIAFKSLNGSCRIYIFKERKEGVAEIQKKVIEAWALELDKEIEILKYIQEEQAKKMSKIKKQGEETEKAQDQADQSADGAAGAEKETEKTEQEIEGGEKAEDLVEKAAVDAKSSESGDGSEDEGDKTKVITIKMDSVNLDDKQLVPLKMKKKSPEPEKTKDQAAQDAKAADKDGNKK